MIYAIYQDDGPLGICTQDCYTTSCWKKLYIFETHEQLREIENKILNYKNRKNPKLTDVFSSIPGYCMNEVRFYQNGRMVITDTIKIE